TIGYSPPSCSLRDRQLEGERHEGERMRLDDEMILMIVDALWHGSFIERDGEYRALSKIGYTAWSRAFPFLRRLRGNDPASLPSISVEKQEFETWVKMVIEKTLDRRDEFKKMKKRVTAEDLFQPRVRGMPVDSNKYLLEIWLNRHKPELMVFGDQVE